MDIRNIFIVASVLAIPIACSHDRRDSETPDQMTPASGTTTPEPLPSTTNQPGQPGSPEPMNSPTTTPGPNNTDTPRSAPDTIGPSQGNSGAVGPNTSDSSLRASSGDARPSQGGADGSGGKRGSGGGMGGSGGSSSAGRRAK
ncbi:MAG TPA: hypothetical protein VGK73_14960 [Polyangiaceae bacterium]